MYRPDTRIPSRAGSVSFHGRKTTTPARYVTNHPPVVVVPVLKPVQILNDLKLKAKDLPEKDFILPQWMYTTPVLNQTKTYGRNVVQSTPETKFRPLDRVKMEKIEKTASPAPSTSHLAMTLLRQPVIGIKKPINIPVATPQASQGRTMNYAEVMAHKEANRAAASSSSFSTISLKPVDSSLKDANRAASSISSLSTSSLKSADSSYKDANRASVSNHPTPISPFSIISLKPADSSLLPPPAQPVIQKDNPEAKQKKVVLESLVNRISLTKREDGTWRMRSPPASAAPSPASSSSSPDAEGRKNKRKSSDPSKLITDEESPASEVSTKSKRKGGSSKKNGGRKSTPSKKRKIAEMEMKEEDQSETEDDVLPPRIIVEGQEPGTELEWDEEEIIILRVGETPEDRPPVMKRKMAPEEKLEKDVKMEEEEEFEEESEEEMDEEEEEEEEEQAGEGEEETDPSEPSSLETSLEEEQLSTAPVSLNSSQSSEVYAADVSSNVTRESSLQDITRNSSNSCSPTMPTVSSVLSSLTATVCGPVSPSSPSSGSLSPPPSLATPLSPPPPYSVIAPPSHSLASVPPGPVAPETRESTSSPDSASSSFSSSQDSSSNGSGRAKRIVRIRARYSPTPEESPSISRCSSQTALDTTDLHPSPRPSPI